MLTSISGEAEDRSGPSLKKLIEEDKLLPGHVISTAIVADETQQIKEKLIEWSDRDHLDVIITTGGTGFSPRYIF